MQSNDDTLSFVCGCLGCLGMALAPFLTAAGILLALYLAKAWGWL